MNAACASHICAEAVRSDDLDKPYMKKLLSLAGVEARKLQSA